MSEPIITRHDGWTPDRQLLFLKALARTLSVTAAAAAAGMAREGAYRFRRRHPDSLFARTWAELESLGPPRRTAPPVTFPAAPSRGKGHEAQQTKESPHSPLGVILWSFAALQFQEGLSITSPRS